MAAKKEASVRRAIKAFNDWDLDAMTALVTEDFEFVPSWRRPSRPRPTGATRAYANAPLAWVVEFRAEKISAARSYGSEHEALAAAGLLSG